jgi:hypothetical protein
MAKLKKPDNETPQETQNRHTLENFANLANRSEKTSWNRKMDNMVKLLLKLQPIEDKILDLISTEKTPILDEISNLRKVMVDECVHPFEYLSLQDNQVTTCKFCNKRIVQNEWTKK